MIDSRLRKALAALDIARNYLLDIVDDGPTPDSSIRDFNHIDAARQFVNSACVYVQYADSSRPLDIA